MEPLSKSCWRSPAMVNGKINCSIVGVGEDVNVMVGTGEGVIVSMATVGGGKDTFGEAGAGWQATSKM